MTIGDAAVNLLEKVILTAYNWTDSILTPLFGGGSKVLILAFLFILFSVFIWLFYNSLSDKSLFTLNLNKYNKSSHPVVYKLLGAIFYFIEHLLITPALVILWFFGLSLMILFLASERSIEQILIISGAIVVSVRVLTYFNRDLAKDIAKLFPLVLISTFVISASAFNPGLVASRILSISALLSDISYFLLTLFVVEVVMRLLYTFRLLFKSEEDEIDGDKSSGSKKARD